MYVHSRISSFRKMVKIEVTFTLKSQKFWSWPITIFHPLIFTECNFLVKKIGKLVIFSKINFLTVNLLCSFAFEVKTSFTMQSKELGGLKDLLVVSSFLYGQLCWVNFRKLPLFIVIAESPNKITSQYIKSLFWLKKILLFWFILHYIGLTLN